MRISTLLLGGFLTLAPTVAFAHDHRDWPDEAPPPRRDEVIVVRPHYVWVGGHHAWHRRHYEWSRGHYVHERPGRAWRDGEWEHRENHYEWRRGEWRR